jgi:2-hydroxy-3-keto-5-methylthiopentenyl-1-phosphate phosphatase
VLEIGSVLIDFDGTACSHDVAEHLLEEFGDPTWPSYDEAWERGEIGAADALKAQAAMLDATTERMLTFALDHCPMDPTFAPFVSWLDSEKVPVAIVSDGFGLYIEPLLRSVGIEDLRVITNTWNGDGGSRLSFRNGHPVCKGCGTCKMRSAISFREAHGSVAFIGEGPSDRFGALYSDLVFAKDQLTEYCKADGVRALAYTDFDDVRRVLESGEPAPGPVAPEICPGWRE